MLTFSFLYREAQKALKEAQEKAGKKGPMSTGGIKKSGKKWKTTHLSDLFHHFYKFDNIYAVFTKKFVLQIKNRYLVTPAIEQTFIAVFSYVNFNYVKSFKHVFWQIFFNLNQCLVTKLTFFFGQQFQS